MIEEIILILFIWVFGLLSCIMVIILDRLIKLNRVETGEKEQ